jgi:hypothetical protein
MTAELYTFKTTQEQVRHAASFTSNKEHGASSGHRSKAQACSHSRSNIKAAATVAVMLERCMLSLTRGKQRKKATISRRGLQESPQATQCMAPAAVTIYVRRCNDLQE